jgi:tight adherence protein B
MSGALCLGAVLLAAWLWWSPARARPGRVHPAIATAAAATLAAGSLVSLGPRWFVVGTVFAAAGWSVHRLGRRVRRRRVTAATAEAVLSACELLAAELGVGRAPPSALARAAQDWPPLRPVAETAAYGGDVAGALADLSTLPGAGGLRLIGAAWAITQHSGSGLADALGQVATAIRADQRTARVVAGELASARATARLVALLPVVALLMASGSGGDPLGFLLGGPFGIACLAAGLALGLAGVWWIESIADSAGT